MYLGRENIKKLFAEWQALQPVKPEYKKKLDEKFRLEFNYNSNHLEGNTLTYGETKLLLIFDQTQGEHTAREYEEIKAHDVALRIIEQEAADKERPLTERFIKELNEILLVRPYWKDAITADGQSTRRQIKVGEYKEFANSVRLENGEIFEYASPQETPAMMSDLVAWYNDEAKKNEFSPLELAALLHYKFIRIHPFDDGNGRTARLLVNYALARYGYPPIIVKTDDKKSYLLALHRADVGDLNAFVDYMAKQLEWSLETSIKAAKGESIDELGDLDKKLSLLRQQLEGDKNGLKEKKSAEVLQKLFQNQLGDFLKILQEELSKFNDLFFNEEFLYQVFNSNNSTVKPLNMDLEKALSYLGKENKLYNSLRFYTFFSDFKKADAIFDVDIVVDFEFEGFLYSISFYNDLSTLGERVTITQHFYHQPYPEEQIRKDVSIITNKVYEYIQQKLSENQS